MRTLFFLSFLLLAFGAAAQVAPLEKTPSTYRFFDGHRSPVFLDATGTAYVTDAAGKYVEYNTAVCAEKTAYPCTVPGCTQRRKPGKIDCGKWEHTRGPIALIHHPARQ